MSVRRENVAGELLLHPASVAAVIVLVLNDHVAKRHFPSFVTGKLSDIAGLFVFPLLVLSFLELALEWRGHPLERSRRRVLTLSLFTAVVFTAMKTWPPAAQAYGHAEGVLLYPFAAMSALVRGAPFPALIRAVVARDVTDLFCLPVLLLSPLVVQRKKARPMEKRVA